MKAAILALPLILAITACEKAADEAATSADATPVATAEAPPPPAPAAAPLDFSEFLVEVDADKDGKMSWAEWQAKGLPESSFKGMTKGERDYVTVADYQAEAAPAGIDANADGKLTVAEFVAFDKMMSEKMKDGPPPGPPPAQ